MGACWRLSSSCRWRSCCCWRSFGFPSDGLAAGPRAGPARTACRPCHLRGPGAAIANRGPARGAVGDHRAGRDAGAAGRKRQTSTDGKRQGASSGRDAPAATRGSFRVRLRADLALGHVPAGMRVSPAPGSAGRRRSFATDREARIVVVRVPVAAGDRRRVSQFDRRVRGDSATWRSSKRRRVGRAPRPVFVGRPDPSVDDRPAADADSRPGRRVAAAGRRPGLRGRWPADRLGARRIQTPPAGPARRARQRGHRAGRRRPCRRAAAARADDLRRFARHPPPRARRTGPARSPPGRSPRADPAISAGCARCPARRDRRSDWRRRSRPPSIFLPVGALLGPRGLGLLSPTLLGAARSSP